MTIRRVRTKPPGLAAALALTGAVALGGCATVEDQRVTAIPDARHPVPGSNELTGPKVSREVAELMAAAGPLAVAAVESMEAARAMRAAEPRAADAREEESARLRTARAQIFDGPCARQRSASLAKGTGPALAGPGSSAAIEKEAGGAFSDGDYPRAASLLQAVHDETKGSLGEKSPELARVSNKLAVAYLSAGDETRAMALAVYGLGIRKQRMEVAGKLAEKGKGELREASTASLDVAESEATVAQIFRGSGAFEDAGKSYRHALEIRTKYLPEDHLCLAQSQNDLGELDYLTGAYASATELYRKALAARERRLRDDHRDRAQSYSNLGSLHRAVGLYQPALGYYRRALASRRKLGEGHPEVARSYHELASLHGAMGNVSRAEAFYEKALAIRRARLEDGVEVAETETALAELYFSGGDYGRAENLLEHAHGIRKARLPADHPDLAGSFADLAKVHQAKLEYARAEQDHREALAIWQKKFGGDHPVVASGLATLGELSLTRGRLDEAASCFTRAHAIRAQKLGADHPDTAESLHQLGTVHYARHDYARAAPLFRLAVEIRKRKLGESHPEVAASLSYLAALLVATHRPDEALQSFRRAQLISEHLLRSAGAAGSEARLDATLRFLRAQEEVVYSLLADRELAPRAAPLALSVALLRKGRSVDGAPSISGAVYLGLSREQREKFGALATTRAQIARQELSPAGGVDPEETRRLAEKAERLEQEVARHSAAIRARRDAPTLDDVVKKVAAALPQATVLVEVVKYRAYQFQAKPGEPRWGASRYSAMVLDGGGAVQVADLGPAAAIDEGVKRFLKVITADVGPAEREVADRSLEKAGQELEGLVIRPVRPFLGDGKSIVLSLDGQLNLLPFWALFDGTGYLIDRYHLTYVTSGRDLLPRPAVKRSGEVAIIARPTFLKASAAVGARAAADRGIEVERDPKAWISQTQFAPGALKLKSPPSPLPGTEQEVKALQDLFPDSKVILGPDATKDHFLELQAPGIVHVATHGIFRPESSGEKSGARGLELTGGLLAPAATKRRSEPLLDAMLLWANVGRPSQGDGTAVLLEPSGLSTALEVAGMNLWGTQLVVLSACETGRGEVDDVGQGVYALRRAIMVAGAETLVTSLWKVDDGVTRELMTAYYKRLLAGVGRTEALRQASLLVRRRHPEPRHWAPFIAIGQIGPVRGLSGAPLAP